MRPIAIWLLLLLIIGCGKKTTPEGELEQAAQVLEAAESPTVVTPQAAPLPASATPEVKPVAPATEMNQALASYRSGNLEDAVTRLHRLRAQTAMTPEQLIAIQNATAAVMGEVYALAAKGDARAIQAVKQYERMQNKQ